VLLSGQPGFNAALVGNLLCNYGIHLASP